MERTMLNTYLLKAMDAYPYVLEEAMEALSYALSFDSKNVQALCLLGKVYAEQMHDYEAAKECYAEAMANGMEMPFVYPDYIKTLVLNEDYNEAQKLLDFALTIKATDKGTLYLIQGQLFEKLGNNGKAIKALHKAGNLGLNNEFYEFVENEINRIKKKIKLKKKGETKKVK